MAVETLAIAPSPDQDESKEQHEIENEKVKELDYQPGPSQSPSSGRFSGHGLAALSSLAIVLFWSFGMGSGFLIWLLVNRVEPNHPPGSLSNHCDGWLIINEGNKTRSLKLLSGEDATESAMTGVVIISAVTGFSSMAVVPLMGLGAFYVASQWLSKQDQNQDAPTPLQLLLLIQMCSEGSWKSVVSTLRYLFRRHRANSSASRVAVSPLIFHTLIITSAVVVLHYGVTVTELWLTAKLGSGYYSVEDKVNFDDFPVAQMLGTQNNASMVVGMMNANGSIPEDSKKQMVDRGALVVINKSPDHYIARINTSTSSSIQDTSYMAAIVRPRSAIPSHWSWTAPTIGMGVKCKPAPCSTETTSFVSTCPPPSEIPYKTIPLPSSGYMANMINNTILRYSATGEILPDLIPLPNTQPQQVNPLYYVTNIGMMESTWSEYGSSSEVAKMHCPNNGGTCPFGVAYTSYFGACEVTLYDVEVTFNGFRKSGTGTDPDYGYSIASTPIPMSQERALQVLAPLVPISSSIFDSQIGRSLGAILVKDSVNPGFSNIVSAEFSRQLLAYVSGMNLATLKANTIAAGSSKLFSRYPLAPVSIYIGVVYAHGVLAIIFFIGIVRKPSRTVVVGKNAWRRKGDVETGRTPVPEILLVQSRLTDPLAVLAEHFFEPNTEKSERRKTLTNAGAFNVQADVTDMVEMENPDTKRVEIGLVQYH
ncbi:hypothetical protein FRC03_009900 [Tulasnella sp. 419]|nr:hypothetical protein FRC03_009900 [Tulasnella sp. 419]